MEKEKFEQKKDPFMDTFATAHELMQALDQRVGTKKWDMIEALPEETLYCGSTESGEVYLISSRDFKNMFVQSFPAIHNAEEFLKGYTSN